MKKLLPIILVVGGLLVMLPSFFKNVEPPLPDIPSDLEGLIIDSPATSLPKFRLTDHDGQPFDNSRLKGKWSLVFFGYTNCPDVCPTTMTVMNKVAEMPGTPKDTQYVFISVDPKRDTPDKLKDFVSFFNEKFIGATGEKSELDKFQEPLGVVYDFEGDTNSDDYIVTHFAAIYIITPEGKERAYILPPHSARQVSRAYHLIRQHYD